MVSTIKAIMFDLYDTLLYVETEGFHRVQRRIAERLGVSREAFLQVWRKDRTERMRGTKGTLSEQFAALAADLGVSIPQDEVKSFADAYGGALFDGAHAYPNTHKGLAGLRGGGCQQG